jgi:hypothetical protein
MGTQGKVVATAIIWTAFTLIMIFADVDATNFINLAILAGAAMISTVAVWEGLNNSQATSKREGVIKDVQKYEKAKRSENKRLARLIESMNEDEIAALESILSSRRDQFDEDEQIELNRLLAEQERSRR